MPLTRGPAARSAATRAREPTATLDRVRGASAAAPDGESAGDDQASAALRGAARAERGPHGGGATRGIGEGGGELGDAACSRRSAGGRTAAAWHGHDDAEGEEGKEVVQEVRRLTGDAGLAAWWSG